MKSILKTYRPEWLVNILNGNSHILLAKYFPKDYVGWVYLYCIMGKLYLVNDLGNYVLSYNRKQWANSIVSNKVVARFYCDKVEEIKLDKDFSKIDEKVKNRIGKAGLSLFQAFDYLQDKTGYAIHISRLEIFDDPRKLYEYKKVCEKCKYKGMECSVYDCRITKAPSNYCYIESEE